MSKSRVLARTGRLVAATAVAAGVVVASTIGASAQTTETDQCHLNIDSGAYTCDPSTAGQWAVTEYRLASLYLEPNYTGDSLTYWRAGGACDTDRTTIELADPSFNDPSFNNAFESVKTYSNCRIKLFRWTNYGGGNTGWINEWADFNTGDDWADNVSSIKIS